MSKRRKKKINPRRIAAAVAASVILLVSSFFAAKEYKIRQCMSSTLQQLESVLGPCPEELKAGVLKQIRVWCENGQ